mgnify:CR=1 FL=1
MARIAGINIPPHKHAEIGLTAIYGIGRTTARRLLLSAGSAAAVFELGQLLPDLGAQLGEAAGEGADLVLTLDRQRRGLVVVVEVLHRGTQHLDRMGDRAGEDGREQDAGEAHADDDLQHDPAQRIELGEHGGAWAREAEDEGALFGAQLHPRGVGVSIINPGFVETPLTAQNQFHMPALMQPHEAASAILEGWAQGRFEIHFPRRFSLWLKALELLPISVYFRLVRRITGA